jgi:hypothetical protein
MSLQWFSLRFPSELTAEAVLHFTRSLAVRPRRGVLMRADPVVCEVTGSGGQVSWRLGVTSRDEQRVLTGLRLALPGIRLEATTDVRPLLQRGWELRLSHGRRALRCDVPTQVAGALLSALRQANHGEVVTLQWVIGPWLHRSAVPPASKRTPTGNGFDLTDLVLDSEQARAMREKYKEPLFGVLARIGVRAGSVQRQRALRQAVIGALQLVRSPGVGLERRLLLSRWVAGRIEQVRSPLIGWPCVLNANELVSCLGWPVGNPIVPGVSYSGGRQLPPPVGALVPPSSDTASERITGQATFPGQEGHLRLSVSDALRHLHLIGPTGTGKSTTITRLALADIQAGRSVVVVDPKRDMVRAIADRIPEHRRHDVVWLDVADPEPVGFNVLVHGSSDLAVDSVVHVIHELYGTTAAPRMTDILRNSLLSLSRVGGMTLCELVPLLLNPAFRRSITRRLQHDALGVAPFWQWFESLSEAERATVVAPVLNKLRAFTNNVAVRGVIGQTQGFDLMELFTGRKVLLISLAKDEVGSETAYLFGSLLVSALWSAIQRRSGVAPEQRHPVMVFLDEFGEVMRLPVSMPDALAASRGLGVGWTLAHQDLSQLTPSSKAAVFANARSRIAYQLGYDDATTLARVLGGGLTATDLQSLDTYDTYQALCVGGRTTTPASVRTLPLPDSLGSFEEVVGKSRARYGKARTEVDAELLARRSVQVPGDTPIGSRRRENKP